MESDSLQMTTTVKLSLVSLALPLLFMACNSSSSSSSTGVNPTNPNEVNWLIPQGEIVDGGPGVDGIPSIENPNFTNASDVDFLQDSRRVAGIRIGNDIRAYPHQVLDWHEIVNDSFDGNDVAVTFCPLTGTSIAIERKLGGNTVEYGVSGLLFRNNLIMYDRFSSSFWSQMQIRSVGGDFAGRDADVVQLIETTWGVWKEMFPESKVLNTNTGFSRSYSGFAYGSDYTSNNNRIIFPIRNEDRRLDRKDRVHSILPTSLGQNPDIKAYPIALFNEGASFIEDNFMGNDYVIVGDNSRDLINAFKRSTTFERGLSFDVYEGSNPKGILTDQHGNIYDIFGYAISGPNEGTQLTPARSYTGYWFAFADFYPNISLYSE